MRLIQRTVVAAIVVLTVYAFAIGPVAAAEKATSLEQEYSSLYQQLLLTPNDLELMARFAYVATRLENYEAAIMTFERMLLINPNLPLVKLETGVLYYRLAAYETARVYLEDVARDPASSAGQKARAERFLDTIDGRLSDHDFGGTVMAGVRYQTNANAGPDSLPVLAGGFPAFLPSSSLARDDLNAFFAGQFDYDVDLGTPLQEDWESDLLLYATKQFDVDDIDVAYMELATGPRLSVLPQSVDGLFLRPFGFANGAFIDYDIDNYGFGGGVELEKEYGDDALVGIRYLGRYRVFDDLNPTVSAFVPGPGFITVDNRRDAFEHVISLYGHIDVAEDTTLNALFAYTDEQAKAALQSFDRYDARVSLSHYYDAPFGLTPWPWYATIGGTYIVRDYDAPDIVVDPTRTREDDEFRVWFTNNFQVTRDWSIWLQIKYVEVDSNLPNFDRDNLSTSLAVRHRF